MYKIINRIICFVFISLRGLSCGNSFLNWRIEVSRNGRISSDVRTPRSTIGQKVIGTWYSFGVSQLILTFLTAFIILDEYWCKWMGGLIWRRSRLKKILYVISLYLRFHLLKPIVLSQFWFWFNPKTGNLMQFGIKCKNCKMSYALD